jgi:antitoxin StbD
LTNPKKIAKIVVNKILKRIFNMTRILANYTTSISELKKSPSSVIENANGESIAILNHNRPSAYLVPSEVYEKMMEMLDEYYLIQKVKERLDYKESDLIEVSLDEL